jgi:hypothetical protein
MTDSFILGLGSGSACLVTCGMVMFPYLLSETAGTARIATDLAVFMLTRLIVYLVLATVAWYFGQAVMAGRLVGHIIPGILYIVFSVMLVWYSIDRRKKCPAKFMTTVNEHRLIPFLLGVVNSIGFCPALFLVITKGAAQDSLPHAWMDFLAFFAGSSVWFLPLPVAGKLKKKEVLATIGTLATGLAGVIFMIKGLTNLIEGLIYGK